MDDLRDLIAARADKLDQGVVDIMTEVKLIAIDMLRIEIRVLGYNNGVLRIATEDASAASELRLHARQILDKLRQKFPKESIRFIRVSIR